MEALGASKVKDDEAVRITYATDPPTQTYRIPSLVVLPENREDVRTALLLANKYKVPVTPILRGVNTAGYGVPSSGGIVLDLRRMDKIIEINTDSGYAVVEAGINFDKFTAAIRAKGYRCAIPTAPGGSAPVGNYLSRPSNSLCNRHLDSIIDLEVVLPDGTIFNTGSSQFPHAGSSLQYGPHPNLMGLLTCAYGTMGVVTKAAIRIYPINEVNRVNLAAFDDYASALDFVKEIIDNNIPEHCIIWNWQLYETFAIDTSKPGAVIPAKLKGDPKKAPKGTPYCVVTTFLSGYVEMMVAGEKVLARVARKHGGKTLSEKEAKATLPIAKAGWDELYGNYHQIEPTFFGLGRYMVWIMFAEPKDVKEMEKWAVAEVAKTGVRPVCYYSQPFDFGRSIFFRIFCFPDPYDQKQIERVATTYQSMFKTAMEKYGAIPMRFKTQFPALHLTSGYGEVLKKIKYTLDPNNILNRDIGLFRENQP